MAKEPKIKIIKNGPYLVEGNIPIAEKIITPTDRGYQFTEGRELPQAEVYALCRCGQSKNAPFCDSSHQRNGFDGTETASRARYEDRAGVLEGPYLNLLDDNRCALARFCHREQGDAWSLTLRSDDENCREEAIRAASECPAGRLVAVDQEGRQLEDYFQPSIDILQDPQKRVSAGIYVKGGIPIEGADGETYEVRNRVTLCRCGNSHNKPFCDAQHVAVQYLDKEEEI
jgi:CDGSH-type Zn-finger protein